MCGLSLSFYHHFFHYLMCFPVFQFVHAIPTFLRCQASPVRPVAPCCAPSSPLALRHRAVWSVQWGHGGGGPRRRRPLLRSPVTALGFKVLNSNPRCQHPNVIRKWEMCLRHSNSVELQIWSYSVANYFGGLCCFNQDRSVMCVRQPANNSKQNHSW